MRAPQRSYTTCFLITNFITLLSFFSIQVWLNMSKIYQSPTDRHVVTNLTDAMLLSKDARDSWGYLSMADGDKNPNIVGKMNLAFDRRRLRYTGNPDDLTGSAPIVMLLGTLPTDLHSLNRLIPDKSELTIDLERHSDKFLIFAGKDYGAPYNFKLIVKDVQLYVRRPQLKQSYIIGQERLFKENKKAHLYFYENETLRFQLPMGVATFQSLPIVTKSRHPVKIFVAFCPETALLGSYQTNPLDFAPPKGLSSAYLTLNGEDPMGFVDMTANDRDSGQDEVNYFRFCNTMQAWGSNSNPPRITLEQYKSNYFILACDLTSNATVVPEKLNLVRQGLLHINLRFKGQGLTTSWVAIVWAICPQLITYAPGETPSITQETGAVQ